MNNTKTRLDNKVSRILGHSTLKEVQNDPGFKDLSPDTQKAVKSVTEELLIPSTEIQPNDREVIQEWIRDKQVRLKQAA